MRSTSIALALAVLMTGTHALGDAPTVIPPTASLQWDRGAGADTCIGADDLRHSVEQLLGRNAFTSDRRAELMIRGGIQHSTSGPPWQVTIATFDSAGVQTGVREWRDEHLDCSMLDSVLTLVTALLVDPEAALEPHGSVATRSSVQWSRLGIRLSGSLDVGTFPTVTPGAALSISLAPRRSISLEWNSAYWSLSRAVSASAGSTFDGATTGLSLCPRWSASRLEASICLGAIVGVVWAHGFGYDSNHDPALLIAGLTSHATLAVTLTGPLFLFASAGVSLYVVRPSFTYTDASGVVRTLVQVGVVGGMAQIGLGFRFWS